MSRTGVGNISSWLGKVFGSPERLWLVGIIALALVLRLYRLGADAFWQDEAYNLLVSENLWAAITTGEFVSNNPPLFFALLALWRNLGFEGSEFGMRLIPALFGTASVGMLYVIVRRFYGAAPALIAALLLAVNPLHIYHSQDLKDYIVLTFTGPLALYCLYRAWESNTVWTWTAYGVAAAIACYSELFVAPLLLVGNIWFLCSLEGYSQKLKGWLIANVLGALAFLPQLGIMLYRARAMLVEADQWWLEAPGLLDMAVFLKAVAFGYSDTEPLVYIAPVILVALGITGGVIAWNMRWRETSFMVSWLIGSIVIVIGISYMIHSIFLIRALIAYVLPIFAFAGVALSSCTIAMWRYSGLGLLIFLSVIPLYEHYKSEYPVREFPHRPGVHPPRDYDEVTQYIMDNWEEGDVVIHAGPNTWVSLHMYGLRENAGFYAGVRKDFVEFFRAGHIETTDSENLTGYFIHPPDEIVEGKERAWLVFAEWEREYLPGNAYDVWLWMDSRFTQVDRKEFKGMVLYEYQLEADPPVRTVRRNRDNGVARVLEYEGGIEKTYRHMDPDLGLMAKSVEDRRGDLLLYFEEEEEGAPEDERVFTLENQGDQEVSARIEVVPNDGMWRAASAYRREPLGGVWDVTPMSVTGEAPQQWPMPVLRARLEEGKDEKEAWARFCDLQPGDYETWFYTRGRALEREIERANIRIEVDGVDISSPALREEETQADWRWFKGEDIALGENGECINITLTALRNPEFDTSWFEIGYIAFVKNMDSDGDYIQSQSPGEVQLEPGESRSWSVDLDPERSRLDIWVYEKEEDGKAYWIFEELS
ncbi:MAG: glycosyltransferase family 39 protein [Candidatus Hydrogenedentota bacterium]